MTGIFVAISLVMGAAATVAIFRLVRPQIGGRMVWPAIAAALLTIALTSILGALTGAARLDYLLGISAFALPVLVLLEAAAIGAGADRLGRWVLMLAWGLVVFPGAALIPLIVTESCRLSDCGFEDFGGALPLFVSASAYVILARAPSDTVAPAPVRGGEAIAGVLGFWASFAVWLTSLEADLDEFVPRIMLAGAVGPIAGALGWLLVDRLKAVDRVVTRSLAYGFLAGIAATVSGAVAVSFPWSVVVGALAGIVGALLHALRIVARLGTAARWGITLLGATAMGFLAPPISGDTIGVLFSARVGVLQTPLLAFLGVAAGSVLVSAPAWALVRRRHRAAVRVESVRDSGSGKPG